MGEGSLKNLSDLGVAVLAVLGAALAGAALTASVVWLVCRLAFGKQPPKPFAKLLNYLGAIAGALFIGAYLKLGGGTGHFFGTGTGQTGAQSKGVPKDTVATKSGEEKPEKRDSPPARQDDRVRVTILGGSLVKGKAFYRLDGSAEPVDLARVKEAIGARQKAGPVAGVDILIYQNSLGYNTDPVRQLKAVVTGSGLTPNPAELPGDIPP